MQTTRVSKGVAIDPALVGAYRDSSDLLDRPPDRVRLPVDVRYQPVAAPKNDRYFGLDPRGRSGGGYGELNGARPPFEKWHALTGGSHADQKVG